MNSESLTTFRRRGLVENKRDPSGIATHCHIAFCANEHVREFVELLHITCCLALSCMGGSDLSRWRWPERTFTSLTSGFNFFTRRSHSDVTPHTAFARSHRPCMIDLPWFLVQTWLRECFLAAPMLCVLRRSRPAICIATYKRSMYFGVALETIEWCVPIVNHVRLVL